MHAHSCLVVLVLVLALNCQVYAGRIIGGQEAAPHSRPYMVLVKTTGSKKACGGFLLKNNFVMTAAHCQDTSYRVLLGLHNVHDREGVQEVSVDRAIPHEDYNPDNYMHDIMLLKLSSEVTNTNTVRPIALADGDDSRLPQSCSVAGWGRNDSHSIYNSLILMEANVTLIEEDECKKRVAYCSEETPGPRKGDSGGPLVCDGKAYGVVSGGLPVDKKLICVYIKIPDYKSWIDGIVDSA